MFLLFKQSVRVALAVGEAEDVAELDTVDDDTATEDGEPPQLPNADWHPDPQYALVDPQYPHWEQQLPNELPAHV